MGVMIKGFEIPKNCLGCSTKCDPENRKCNIDGHVFEETFSVVTTRRDKSCPLVEIEERKVGHWEIKKVSIHPYGNDVACSECGFTMGSSFGYKYCPMCGCKMEGQE